MPINLSKGQKIDLTKEKPSLHKIRVGLGWDVNEFDTGGSFDLDASAFLAGSNGKCSQETDFIFYGNLEHPSKAVVHTGDNRTGEGEGDDEVINVDLALVPDRIERIAFTVTIYEAEKKNQNFGQVANAYIRLIDEETNEEIVRYDLGEDFSIETAIVVGELYKNNGNWKFNAIGSGFQGGLAALCGHFGLEAE
ncbi:TerD family protein [Lachnobacterium bovis]|uniref:TerD family protein n=1 Tax=Lachnobacterium bovis TaxID=140626 RepID=UPI000481CF25|nr:TerD family protein [Lachnobacterium bovis]